MKKIVLVLTVLTLWTGAYAQITEKKEELKGSISKPLADLRLAGDLVRYGYSRQEALPLIQALLIMNEAPTQPFKEAKTEEKNATKDDSKISFDYQKIMADAKAFAEGNDNLLAMIASVEAEKAGNSRGAVSGPQRAVEVVLASDYDSYSTSFIAGYLAEVAVVGDGDTDLDLYVYDSNGNLIASDTDYTDDCYVSWTPAWTGRFTIKVVNRGLVANRYVLLTN